MNANAYVGSEVELFEEARHWKRYWHSQIAPYSRRSVLEVRAGNSNNTRVLSRPDQIRWLRLEPDFSLCRELRSRTGTDIKPDIVVGTLGAISDQPGFDTIPYLDDLERIEMDFRELASSARILKPRGHLIVLGPARPRLYSPFDRAIGHFRRYTRATLRAAAPDNLRLVMCRYLDCAGLAASSANALFLKQYVDPVLWYACGKSALAVWCNGAQ